VQLNYKLKKVGNKEIARCGGAFGGIQKENEPDDEASATALMARSLAAVTTASAALGPGRWLTVTTASISLAGSLTNLFAQQQKAGIGGSKEGILDLYSKLASLVPDVGGTRAELRGMQQLADFISHLDEVEKNLARANDLSREVSRCAAAIPGALTL
jgi:hypothetical protein